MTWILILMACVSGDSEDGTKDRDRPDTADVSTETGDGEDSSETGATSGSSATLTGEGAFTPASVLFWYYRPDSSDQTVGPEILITEWDQACEDLEYYYGDPSLEGEGRYVYLLGFVACNDGIDDGSPEWGGCDGDMSSEGTYDRMNVNECSELDSSEVCRFIDIARVGTAQGPSEDDTWTMGDFTDSADASLTIDLYNEDAGEGSFRIDSLEGVFTSATNCGPSEAEE